MSLKERGFHMVLKNSKVNQRRALVLYIVILIMAASLARGQNTGLNGGTTQNLKRCLPIPANADLPAYSILQNTLPAQDTEAMTAALAGMDAAVVKTVDFGGLIACHTEAAKDPKAA
jgi:hypothetical protein